LVHAVRSHTRPWRNSSFESLCEQPHDQEVQQQQPELVRRPHPLGKERVRARVMPDPLKPRRLQHPAHGVLAGPAEEPHHQHPERLERRRTERTSKEEQQRIKRTWSDGHRR